MKIKILSKFAWLLTLLLVKLNSYILDEERKSRIEALPEIDPEVEKIWKEAK
jgi:hypothetical protein